ncbi:DUF3788 family protein [Candidatus Thorarchaeota archaeon]|nr:MAG: DUF3788 family protein [Candidatus Thorarchaeota archaeon]
MVCEDRHIFKKRRGNLVNDVVKEKIPEIGKEPSEEEIYKFLGKQAGNMWRKIANYLNENYEFEPVRSGEGLDATIRYRRSGKTLLTFYPKKGELTILIIFGKKEVENFKNSKAEFSSEMVDIFVNTKQYHDGRWLHIKTPPFNKFEDVKKLLTIKKKPKRG